MILKLGKLVLNRASGINIPMLRVSAQYLILRMLLDSKVQFQFHFRKANTFIFVYPEKAFLLLIQDRPIYCKTKWYPWYLAMCSNASMKLLFSLYVLGSFRWVSCFNAVKQHNIIVSYFQNHFSLATCMSFNNFARSL